MHIGIVTHTLGFGDGQGRVNYEIAAAALDRGHRVTALASTVDAALAARNGLTWVRIDVDGWPSALLRNQVFAWRTTRWLRQHRARLDVVLANGAITWAPADVNAAHFVHTAWLRSPVHTARLQHGLRAGYQRLYTALNARWERHAFRQARTVVAVSDRVRSELLDAGVPEWRIAVIPNGVDLDEFAPGPADRTALGLPDDVPLALFVGDLQTPRKNLDTVLRALRHTPALHLAVVGRRADSPYPALAERLGLSARVRFLGFRTDVPALMRAADLCACPSRYEPFSLVLLEALASGCPVVTASPVGAATLLQDDCGIVVNDPEDASALAQAFAAVLDAPDPHALRRSARRVAESHSWAQMADAYLHLLELEARRSPVAASSPSAPSLVPES